MELTVCEGVIQEKAYEGFQRPVQHIYQVEVHSESVSSNVSQENFTSKLPESNLTLIDRKATETSPAENAWRRHSEHPLLKHQTESLVFWLTKD